jgi:hypothetical protein
VATFTLVFFFSFVFCVFALVLVIAFIFAFDLRRFAFRILGFPNHLYIVLNHCRLRACPKQRGVNFNSYPPISTDLIVDMPPVLTMSGFGGKADAAARQ